MVQDHLLDIHNHFSAIKIRDFNSTFGKLIILLISSARNPHLTLLRFFLTVSVFMRIAYICVKVCATWTSRTNKWNWADCGTRTASSIKSTTRCRNLHHVFTLAYAFGFGLRVMCDIYMYIYIYGCRRRCKWFAGNDPKLFSAI